VLCGLQMKTIQAEGLIACAWPGGSLIGRGDGSAVGRILFAVELSAGQLRYVFDDAAEMATAMAGVNAAASRPLLIRAGAGQPLNDNRWHDVAVVIVGGASDRSDLQHTVHVDNATSTEWLPRLSSSIASTPVAPVIELFIGGVTPGLYHSLPKQVCFKDSTTVCYVNESALMLSAFENRLRAMQTNPAVKQNNKMLSYRRETALQGTLVLAESGRLELRDNILLIL